MDQLSQARLADVSVIIVSYNTREALRRCLTSLPDGVRTMVVDNASADGSGEMVRREFPGVALSQSYVNRGFGRGANAGLAYCETEYALILNADITVQPGAIERLVEFMSTHPRAVACGGRLEFEDGRFQPSCAARLTLWAVFCEQTGLEKLLPRRFGGYWMSDWDHASTRAVEQLMGACLMLRRLPSSLEGGGLGWRVSGEAQPGREEDLPPNPPPQVEGGMAFPLFDERFFLYCEDTELCYRLRRAGEIWYVHDAVFRHALGASGEGRRAEMVSLYNRGKELYFLIHQGFASAIACRLLNLLGATLRLAFKPKVFWRVWLDCLRLPIGYQPSDPARPPRR